MYSPEVQRVIAAWTIAGPAPDHHRRMQAELRNTWPYLAGALDALAEHWLTDEDEPSGPRGVEP